MITKTYEQHRMFYIFFEYKFLGDLFGHLMGSIELCDCQKGLLGGKLNTFNIEVKILCPFHYLSDDLRGKSLK